MSESFRSAEGRPIVGADTAEDIGEVKGFVVDTTASRVEAIHVSGRGRKAELIAWDDIQSFGNDAVIARSSDASSQVDGDHDTQAVKGNITMRDARVLTTLGFDVGAVEDATFDADSGELLGVTTDRGQIDVGRLRSLGSYALVVDDA